ncbi:MAG: thiol-disulfide oxidoreductase DCC family protein, partial [Candidatus Zixiibacteriota bacterium]
IKLPSIEALEKHMYLISPDGVFYKGADALAEMLKIFPESKIASRIASFPPFKPLARLIYAIVAKNRMKLSKLISSH